MGTYWLAIQTEGPQIMKFFVAIWLALVALDSLTDAGPVPENRGKSPPKEVQTINKWLGEDKNSDILKDILKIAKNIKDIKKNKALGAGNADDITNNDAGVKKNKKDVKANADAITNNDAGVKKNKNDVKANAGDITNNDAGIKKNKKDVKANADAITNNADAI